MNIITLIQTESKQADQTVTWALKTPVQRALLNRALWRGRIHYLPGTYDSVGKNALINAYDAMLHARKIGETFGIAIGDFALRNKPIVTFMNLRTPHRWHYELLGDDGNYYTGVKSLLRLLYLNPAMLNGSSIYKTEFTPEKVMQQFRSVFLDGSALAPVEGEPLRYRADVSQAIRCLNHRR